MGTRRASTLLLCGTLALGLGACKPAAEKSAAGENTPDRVQALDYLRLVQIGLQNAYFEGEQKPLGPLRCDDPLLGAQKRKPRAELRSCVARMDDARTPLVAARFENGWTLLADYSGVREVPAAELPDLGTP